MFSKEGKKFNITSRIDMYQQFCSNVFGNNGRDTECDYKCKRRSRRKIHVEINPNAENTTESKEGNSLVTTYNGPWITEQALDAIKK